MAKRVSFLIDGFNLYHSIDAAKRDRIIKSGKWLDVWSLCKNYIWGFPFSTDSKLDVSYYKLKYLLGHSVGSDVTGKHYAQVTVDDVREAAQEIADYLKKQMKMKTSLLEVVG